MFMFDPAKKKSEKIGEFLGFGVASGIFFSLLFYVVSKFTGIEQMISYRFYISSIFLLYFLKSAIKGMPKKNEKRELIC